MRMIRMLPSALRYLTKGLSRDELKAHLIATFLCGADEGWVKSKAVEFRAAFWTRLMRPSGIEAVAAESVSGAQVTICSASPSLVLQPFADQLGIRLIGTELEVIDGRLSGFIKGSNCRCEAKVDRLRAEYGDLTKYRLRAWGDTRGDHELLAAAQDAHWRHFHTPWRRGRLRTVKMEKQLQSGEAIQNALTGVPGPGRGKHDQKRSLTMALSLAKNQTISLEKTAGAGLAKITLGLGWDPVKSGLFGRLLGNAGEIDLDASCILFDENLEPVDLVWFRQLQSKDRSIVHSGDNRTGQGDGDDESIGVELDRLPAAVKHLVFTVNSFTGQNFEKVENAYCRIVDTARDKELARFNLSEKGRHTGIVMASLSRGANDWAFKAIGTTTNGRTADDLIALAVQAVRA